MGEPRAQGQAQRAASRSVSDRGIEQVASVGPPAIDDGWVETALDELVRQGVLGDLSASRLGEILVRFLAYLQRGCGVPNLAEVTQAQVEGFVTAPIVGAGGVRQASVATAHGRRSAVRLLFRVLREQHIVDSDPTLDVSLPARSSLAARPLSDDDVAECRSASLASLGETRLPAAWALAEATARTAELAHVRVLDIDRDSARVWLHGASKTVPRWGQLGDWGAQQVARRIEDLRARRVSQDTPLVYQGSGPIGAGQAASCNAINAVLTRAGLGDEPDVRPVSVAAWAGGRILAESGRIDDVARALGMRSLDRAARLIGWDWTQPKV